MKSLPHNIIRILVFVLAMVLLSSAVKVTHAATEYFYATNDAHVWESFPDMNGANDSVFAVGRDSPEGGPRIWSYVGFSNIMDVIPSNAIVDSAELRLYRFMSSGSFIMGVRIVSGNWWEHLVTWNNKPSDYPKFRKYRPYEELN